jgi:hypothetical protein
VTNAAVAIEVVTNRVVARRAEYIRADLEAAIVSTAIEAVAGAVAREKPWLTVECIQDHLEMYRGSSLSISHAEVHKSSIA